MESRTPVMEAATGIHSFHPSREMRFSVGTAESTSIDSEEAMKVRNRVALVKPARLARHSAPVLVHRRL